MRKALFGPLAAAAGSVAISLLCFYLHSNATIAALFLLLGVVLALSLIHISQAKMFMFMPLMLGYFFYNFSSGLVLYYLTGNLVGIVFQLIAVSYTHLDNRRQRLTRSV